jgi:hypothetical protein
MKGVQHVYVHSLKGDIILQSASLDDSSKTRAQALTMLLQIALENSGGALKMKVAEVPGDHSAENLLTPLIIEILESEPMLSVSKQSWFMWTSKIMFHV